MKSYVDEIRIVILIEILTLFTMSIFGATHGWSGGGGVKKAPTP